MVVYMYITCVLYLIVNFCTAAVVINMEQQDEGSRVNFLTYQDDDGVECNLEFVSRKEWGARTPTETPQHIPATNMTFIHHSAGPDCTNKSECIKNVRGIQNFHMDTRKWADIGYNFVIGGDGRVYEGRGWQIQGAHALSYNHVSHGICILGNYMNQLPTPAATATAKALMKCGVKLGHIKEDFELFGHRDGRCTECPGDKLYKYLQAWPHYSRRNIPIICPEKTQNRN